MILSRVSGICNLAVGRVAIATGYSRRIGGEKIQIVLKMGARLTTDKATRERMLHDVDKVARKNLDEVISSVKRFQIQVWLKSRVRSPWLTRRN